MFYDKIAPIKTKPIIKDRVGQAWKVNLSAFRARLAVDPLDDAGLGIWVVEAPWANLAWHTYVLTLIHLRPLRRETEPLKLYLPGASHEMWLMALDPDGDRQSLLDGHGFGKCQFLTPKNFAAQFIEPNDDAAIRRIERTVLSICKGELSPDTDFIRHWVRLFGDNMISRAEQSPDQRGAGRKFCPSAASFSRSGAARDSMLIDRPATVSGTTMHTETPKVATQAATSSNQNSGSRQKRQPLLGLSAFMARSRPHRLGCGRRGTFRLGRTSVPIPGRGLWSSGKH
jgi:hypothetical protein